VLLLRWIPERHRGVVKEVVTFCAVGGVNTIVGQLMFNVFLTWGVLTGRTISTALATACSFVLNRHVTYRHRPRTSLRRELPLFIGLNLVGLGIQLGILDGCQKLFGLHQSDRLELNVVSFGGVLVGTVFLLLTYRTFVFKTAGVEPAEAVTAQPVHVVAAQPAPRASAEDVASDRTPEVTGAAGGADFDLDALTDRVAFEPIPVVPAVTTAR